MRRWGQIPEAKPDTWYADIAKQVYRPDLYLAAAKLLVDEGKAKKEDFPWTSDGYRAPTSEFIDGVTFDGRKPNAYIESLAIGLKGSAARRRRESRRQLSARAVPISRSVTRRVQRPAPRVSN